MSENSSPKARLFRIVLNSLFTVLFFNMRYFPEWVWGLIMTILPYHRYLQEVVHYVANIVGSAYFQTNAKPEKFDVSGIEVHKLCGKGSDVDSKTVVLYAHCGGYFLDSTLIEFPFITMMSSHIGIPIYFVRYPVIPENSMDDTIDAMVQVYDHLVKSKFNVCLLGISSGGHTVVRMQQKIMELGLPNPRGMSMFSPTLCFTLEDDHPFINAVFGKRDDLALHRVDLSGFPPIWIQYDLNAALDFPDICKEFAQNAETCGVKVSQVETDGLWHSLPLAGYGLNIPEVDVILQEHADWMSKLLN